MRSRTRGAAARLRRKAEAARAWSATLRRRAWKRRPRRLLLCGSWLALDAVARIYERSDPCAEVHARRVAEAHVEMRSVPGCVTDDAVARFCGEELGASRVFPFDV